MGRSTQTYTHLAEAHHFRALRSHDSGPRMVPLVSSKKGGRLCTFHRPGQTPSSRSRRNASYRIRIAAAGDPPKT